MTVYYNELPPLTKNKTLSVTGHRILKKDFLEETVKSDLRRIIEKGYDIFLVGMAIGFDLTCFEVLDELKKEYPFIKLTAVIPCLTQAERYGEKDRKRYEKFLEKADYKSIISEKYTPNCMLKRNDFMLENADGLYAYYNGVKRSGTYYTLSRAKKRGMEIFRYGEYNF